MHISMTTVVQPYSDFYIQVSARKQCLSKVFFLVVFWSVASPSTCLPITSYCWAAFMNILDRKHSMLLKLKGLGFIPKYAMTNGLTLTEKPLLNVHHFGLNQYPGPHDSFSVQNTNSHVEHQNLHNLNFFVCLFCFILILSGICLWVVKNL